MNFSGEFLLFIRDKPQKRLQEESAPKTGATPDYRRTNWLAIAVTEMAEQSRRNSAR
jgi:hypothetical protein